MHQAPCSDISMVRAHIKDAHLEPVVGQLRSDLRAVDVPCMHTCNFRPPARALKWDSFLITLRASAGFVAFTQAEVADGADHVRQGYLA